MKRSHVLMVLLIIVTIGAIVALITTYLYKKEHFYQFDTSMADLAMNSYVAKTLDRQVNPDNVPRQDCWIYYVPSKYHETCRLGWLDKSLTLLMSMRNELQAISGRTTQQQKDLNNINLAIEARNLNLVPSNGYGCKLGFADAKTAITIDYTDQATIASRNDDNSQGQSTSSTSSWAYCWAKTNGEDEARESINAIGTTNAISATPDLLTTFNGSSDMYYRINFNKLDYESVKNSMCSIKSKMMKQMDTYIFVGFDVELQGNSLKINGYDVYVIDRNQFMPLKDYNSKANPMDVYSQLFEFKNKNNEIFISPKSAMLSVSTVYVDPICRTVETPPEINKQTIDLATQLGIKDKQVMKNPDNIDIKNGIEGLDAQYDALATEYVASQGVMPKKPGVEVRRYDLKSNIQYGQPNSLSTAGMDSVFKDSTENMRVTYPKGPNMADWQQRKAWEILGWINITMDGTYNFKMSSDDAGEMFVNDVLVSSHYWYHSADWQSTNKNMNLKPTNLTKGFVRLYARFFQLNGPETLKLYWKKPGDADWVLIPDDVFFYEDNTIIRKMSAISAIRQSMTRLFYSNVKELMESIPKSTFVPASQTDLISSYVSAYDKIYLYCGNPESVLKPTISPQQKQILQNGLIDICKIQQTLNPPEGIDFTQPPVYTVSMWLRVDNPCNASRNVLIYGTNFTDAAPCFMLTPIWAIPASLGKTSLILSIRHPIRNNTNNKDDTSYSIDVNLQTTYYKKWVHVAWTVNRDIMVVYINGVRFADSDTNAKSESGVTSLRASGYTFNWGNPTTERQFGLSPPSLVWRNVPIIVSAGPYYIQKLYWYNTALDAGDIQRLAQETISASPSSSYVPSFVASTFAELSANTNDSGETFLKVNNKAYRVYVAKTNFNGVSEKWLLVLNYLHKAGTNPELLVRTTNDDFPLLGSTTLGDDGSLTPKSWGHLGNSFMRLIHQKCGPIKKVRIFGRRNHPSESSDKIIHFTTTDSRFITYITTGKGNVLGGFNNFTLIPEHNASIPQSAPSAFGDQGDYAMTEFPFWRSGQAIWGIRGGRSFNDPSMWEVDSYSTRSKYNTWHQIWIGL